MIDYLAGTDFSEKVLRINRKLCGVLLLIVAVTSCTTDTVDENVVATIGDFKITEEHFRNSLLNFYQRTGQAVNLNPEVFKAVVDSRLDRYAVVEYARENNWHTSPEARHQKSMIERKVYMEEYERHFIHTKAVVTENDLRELFRRLNTRIRVSHLYAPNKVMADSLYARLKQGESFDQLASEIFQSRQLAETGGDLGYITVDEMDVAFEDMAYRIRSGEFSRPVRTSTGYSIIRVTDSIRNPVITESEFNSNLHRIRPLAYEQKRELALRQDMDEKISGYNISDELINDLWNHVRKQKEVYDGQHFEGEYIPIELPRRLNEANLVEKGEFIFSVPDFLTEANYTPAARRQSATDLHSFGDQVHGMAYRAHVLGIIKKYEGLDQDYIRGSVDETFYSYLFGRFEEHLDELIVISDQEIIDEYEKNGEYYVKPLEFNMAEIITGSEMEASKAYELLDMGTPFDLVLKEYSLDKGALATGGVTGFVSIDEFGVIAPSLTDVKVGDIAGPFQVMNNRYVIFKCLGRNESEPLPVEQAGDRIREYLHNVRKSELREMKIDQTRRSYNATIYTEKLNSVPIEL
jgi:parvulin-like peptidyl-prolyl isomerase